MTAAAADRDAIFNVEDVAVHFEVEQDWLGRARAHAHALNGVDLEVRRGETVGLVGESGCGKSTLGLAVMGLVPLSRGRIVFDGRDLSALNKAELRVDRRRFQVVFQDPQSSLDPRMRVWKIIAEPLIVNHSMKRADLRARVDELALRVGLRADQLERFPHEFSGGQRQRIAVARALALNPDLIVLDEPTSALDVSVQAQILNLLMDLQRQLGLAYLFISHDISVIRHVCDRIAVMYLGEIVELGDAAEVLAAPRHPYTRVLLSSVPSLDREMQLTRGLENTELPSNRVLPEGCFFRERCPYRAPGCDRPQELLPVAEGAHHARCHLRATLPEWEGRTTEVTDYAANGSSTLGQ